MAFMASICSKSEKIILLDNDNDWKSWAYAAYLQPKNIYWICFKYLFHIQKFKTVQKMQAGSLRARLIIFNAYFVGYSFNAGLFNSLVCYSMFEGFEQTCHLLYTVIQNLEYHLEIDLKTETFFAVSRC